ncbi:MAG: hypothetical protein JW763_07105 [candidate division Zixibacteria bacterium]|nr:hypothetical protein [candidate division Zixibacteria bacterium]
MEQNKYAIAGWMAIVQAVLFPLSFIANIVEEGIAKGVFDIHRPIVGPADLLSLIFMGISIYTLLRFRALLNERYQNHDLDLLIMFAVWWVVIFHLAGMGLGILAMIFWPIDEVIFLIAYIGFMATAMVTCGIIDILIAVKLMKIKESVGEYIRVFGYITLVAGICEITVFLAPLALILVPVTAIVLALIFFRDKYEVEFV